MKTRRIFFRVAFVGWLWILAKIAFMLTRFYFQPDLEYVATHDNLIKGLIFLLGLSLLATPVFNSTKGALAANYLILGFFLVLEARHSHWLTILPQFRLFWDQTANHVFEAIQCFLFPDTYFCNPHVGTPFSDLTPIPPSYIATFFTTTLYTLAIRRFQTFCFPPEPPKPPSTTPCTNPAGPIPTENDSPAPDGPPHVTMESAAPRPTDNGTD